MQIDSTITVTNHLVSTSALYQLGFFDHGGFDFFQVATTITSGTLIADTVFAGTGINKVIKVLFQLFMIVVMIPFDRCFLDRAVHAFDLAIDLWMFDFCQSVINVVLRTDTVKDVNAYMCMTGKVNELDTVVCQDCMDCIRQHFDQIMQKRRRRHFPCFLHQLDKGEFRCTIKCRD